MKHIVAHDKQRVGDFARSLLGNEGWAFYEAIGLEENGKLIAAVVFDNYNKISIHMHVAAVAGARWLTREYLRYCFQYPFIELNVKRITGMVCSSNVRARRFCEHLGFFLEATLKHASPTGDLCVYRMLKQDAPYLTKRICHG